MKQKKRDNGEAIAKSMFEMAKLKVPVIAIVIGEGSSGGALAIGVGDRILMLENAIYSILSSFIRPAKLVFSIFFLIIRHRRSKSGG